MIGTERIAEAFAAAHANGRRAALMPYMMGGYPDLQTSRQIGLAMIEAGADLIELGVPFSDPLADGPVIHAAATAALGRGVTVDAVLDVARTLGARVPVIVMCYANPILARGLERFADALVATGVSGLIVPDLPHEEGERTLRVCDERGLALVPLVAPTTTPERMQAIGADARGFVYAVSVTGTTGERSAVGATLADVVSRAAAAAAVPVAVGFGIGSASAVSAAADAGADGVIIGSRLVRAAGESSDPATEVGRLVREFSAALTG